MELFSKQNKRRHHPKGKRRGKKKREEESFRKITTKKERKKNVFHIFGVTNTKTHHILHSKIEREHFFFGVRNKHQFYTYNIIKSFGYKFITITHKKK